MITRKKRLILPTLVFLVSLLVCYSYATLNPYSNLSMMGAGIDSGSSFLKYNKDFYVIVLYTKKTEVFKDTEYIVIMRDKEHIKIELINGPGVGNTRVMMGDDAFDYLRSVNIDLTPFDKIWSDNYCK